jgi:hypothetical protein
VQFVRRVVPDGHVSLADRAGLGAGDFTCHMKRRLLALLMSITPSKPAPTKSCAGVSVMVSPELAIVPIAFMAASVIGDIWD